MKFATSTVLFVTIAPAIAAVTKVNIDVQCSGYNMNKVDVYQATAVANALESSFNEVHGATEDDDSELADVHYGSRSENSAQYLQAISRYTGEARCSRCPGRSMLGLTDKALANWEATFVKDLMDTSHPEFAKITSCNIKMTPRGDAQYGEQEFVFSTESLADAVTKVNIDIQCKGFNMKKVDVYQATTVADALESSFNEVHGAAEDDDTELADVHYGSWSENSAQYLQAISRYTGEARCSRCPGRSMLGLTDKALANWEATFVKDLMDTSRPEFAKITSCNIKMTPRGDAQYAEHEQLTATKALADAVTKVNIDVKCSGYNMNNVDVYQATTVANALESSFNEVHGMTEDDDSELVNVHYGEWSENSAEYLQAISRYTGEARCSRCPGRSMLGLTDKALANWEAAFVKDLMDASHPEFAKITSCNIKMTPRGDAQYGEQELVFSTESLADAVTKVNIDVQCKGFNMKKVDVYQATTVANALESSFNEVHGATEDDDTELADVHYGSWSDNSAQYLQAISRYTGEARCSRCPGRSMLGLTDKGLANWEAVFVEDLKLDKAEFAKITSCNIKMTPRANEISLETKEETTVKCGLRACADA